MLLQVLYIFHDLRPYTQGSTSSLSLSKKESFLTIRQNSLNVTTCIFTSILSNTLPSRFRPNISITPGDWLLGSLAITYTGLSPASIVQLSWTHHIKKVLPTNILSKQYFYYVFDFLTS